MAGRKRTIKQRERDLVVIASYYCQGLKQSERHLELVTHLLPHFDFRVLALADDISTSH